MSTQTDLFTPAGEDKQWAATVLRAKAFVLHGEADECRDDVERARLRTKAVKYEMEADTIVPVEYAR